KRIMSKEVDFSVIKFQKYDDYLDSFTTIHDTYYLGDADVARCIAQLGYRSTKAPYSEDEFAARYDSAMNELQPKIMGLDPFSIYMSPDTTDPVILSFKQRELPIFSKQLSTIVFTSCMHRDGSEMSGYLDLEQSWLDAMRRTFKHTNWKQIYQGKAKLKPKPHHLSFRNLRDNVVLYNDSENFRVLHDHRYGLIFKHKGDHKLIPMCGKRTPFAKNVICTLVASPKFGSYIFYDHYVRKKV
ncbi:hypothetical protein KR093_001865, partial [Drosophila rubida]